MTLEGKVAVVTGAGRNVGKAIALRLAREGAHVTLNDINADALAAVERAAREEGLSVSTAVADISDRAAVEAMMDRTAADHGRIDVLVNNAVVRIEAGERGPFLNVDPDAWHEYMARNLDALLFCTQAAARVMARQRSGCILNISSNGADRAHREMIAYDTLKGAVESFTRAVAIDLAPWNIRVNALRPCAIREQPEPGSTEEAWERRVGAQIPLGRIARPADAAAMAAFLASDEAAFITAEVINIDGGMLAQSRPPQLELKPVIGPEDLDV